MTRVLAGVLCAAVLTACAGNPQRLPVELSPCSAVERANGFAVGATVRNLSDRPIADLALAVSFYRDFRYASYSASARLKKELDPGDRRQVTFEVNAPGARQSGEALRCLVTHIGYLDGTSADIPPAQ